MRKKPVIMIELTGVGWEPYNTAPPDKLMYFFNRLSELLQSDPLLQDFQTSGKAIVLHRMYQLDDIHFTEEDKQTSLRKWKVFQGEQK